MSTATATRRWNVRSFPSGTIIVTTDAAGMPYLYVFGPSPVGQKDEEGDDIDAEHIRYKMCEELVTWMNNHVHRPQWLDDMHRVSETKLVGDDGSSILAVGPMYDSDPPKLAWRECDDQASRDARARLIDRVCA